MSHTSRTAPRTGPCRTGRKARNHRERRCFSTAARDARGQCPPTRRVSVRWLRLRSSCRLAQFLEMFHADAPPLTCVGPHLLDWDYVLMLVLPGVPDQDREGANQTDDRQPPDVPDDGEAADGGEESDDDPGRRIQRHLDGLVVRLVDEPVQLDRGL